MELLLNLYFTSEQHPNFSGQRADALVWETTYTLFHVRTKASADNRKQFNAGIVEFVGEESCLTPREYGRERNVEQYYEVKLK